jgi:hypothetical protein
MKNITLAIDKEVLRSARIYAAERGTTVNALVREYLSQLATQEERAAEARRHLVKLSEESKARLGPDWKWNRDEIYEDRLFPRHERPPVRGFGEGDGGGEEGKGG